MVLIPKQYFSEYVKETRFNILDLSTRCTASQVFSSGSVQKLLNAFKSIRKANAADLHSKSKHFHSLSKNIILSFSTTPEHPYRATMSASHPRIFLFHTANRSLKCAFSALWLPFSHLTFFIFAIFGCVLEKFLPFPFRLGKKFVASQTRLTTRAAKHNEKY